MALREPQPEPSMEEILASIRRIISEEGTPEPSAETGQADFMDEADPGPALEDDLLVFEDLQEDVKPAPAPEAVREPPRAAPAPVEAPPMMEKPAAPAMLVSDPAAAAAAGAFTRLAGTLRISDVHGQTLEAMVQELLRPMLREWLDAHLPKIVEAKVEAELDRISRLVR
jgi:uncharacterized protein